MSHFLPRHEIIYTRRCSCESHYRLWSLEFDCAFCFCSPFTTHMLRAITQSGTGTTAGAAGSLTNALRLVGSLPALRQAPVRTWTGIPKTTIAHDHAAVFLGFQSNQRMSATPRFLQSSLMATSASRGVFTANTGSKAVTVAGARVAGRIVTGQSRQLAFQGLKQHIRTFSTSGIRSNNNSNALSRFAGNFTVDSSNKVVYTIVTINVAVFGTWQYAEGNAKRFHDGRLYMFMFRHFTDSLQNLKEGRVWTLVTSAFSHKEWYHILLNTMVLLSFGDPVSSQFLITYFTGFRENISIKGTMDGSCKLGGLELHLSRRFFYL